MAIGQKIRANGYQQIYFNDGTSQPNHQLVEEWLIFIHFKL